MRFEISEKNILSSTGFVGRVSYTLTLGELSLNDCSKFWPNHIDNYEKFKILSVTGGIPKYLEEVLPHKSAEENINRLCFRKGGFLVDEFEKIFSNLFIRKTDYYKRITKSLVNGAKEQQEICDVLKIERHGRIPEYLHELELAGFVTKNYSWNFKTGRDSELRTYRLSDNYIRFYLKYIEVNLSKIDRNTFQLKSIASLPQWNTILGFQFENLILNNRFALYQILNINPEDIISENPYYQRKTSITAGCQIDYLIQTKFNTLYVCEIKFSKNILGTEIIAELENKIKLLKRPKGFSCRPVLIHVNAVSAEVIELDYFAAIIDFGQLLELS